jgi:hypothetical protein
MPRRRLLRQRYPTGVPPPCLSAFPESEGSIGVGRPLIRRCRSGRYRRRNHTPSRFFQPMDFGRGMSASSGDTSRRWSPSRSSSRKVPGSVSGSGCASAVRSGVQLSFRRVPQVCRFVVSLWEKGVGKDTLRNRYPGKLSRDGNHGDGGEAVSDNEEKLESVHVRHLEIGDDHVGQCLLQRG